MLYSKGELWGPQQRAGLRFLKGFSPDAMIRQTCCPGQHDCSAMINFSKKQASILIFMSPCGTLAFFCSHEKPTFLNSNWFSEGWWTWKNPSWSFLFLTWNLLTLYFTIKWNWKKENKDQVYIQGLKKGVSHPTGYGSWWSPSSNRISFLPLLVLCLQFDP